jgi:hypothetical protein
MITIDNRTLILTHDDILARIPELDGVDPADVTISLCDGGEYSQRDLTDTTIVLRVSSEYPRLAVAA